MPCRAGESQTYTYAPDGQETSYTDSAAGGLPAETVTIGHDTAGDENSLTGASTYVDSLSFTDLDQPLQYTMGTSSEPVYVTDSYDPQTGNLTEQDTQTGTAETSVDDLHYTYNDVQDVTSEADTPSGDPSATDVQCFQYDYLNRLVQAWAQGAAGCATAPSAPAEGGIAPYWDSYTYNVIGNLTGLTSTTPAGAVTTMAATYPAAGKPQPHAISSQTVTSASGSQLTSYGYDAAGHLASSSGPSQDQVLAWDDAGQLTQDAVTLSGATSAEDADFVYDADGKLLLDADPGATTLYLDDEELSLSSGTVTGTRYYSIGSTTVATRTGASGVAYLIADQQGTSSVAVDAGNLAVTRRWFDPFGNPRGQAPATFPAGQKAFVGGTADQTTGFTDLGAREYQPGDGSFVSPDPILKPYDPDDLNPYSYATDNPSTYSDPSGAATNQTNTNNKSNTTPVGPAANTCAGGAASVQVGPIWLSCSTPNLQAIIDAYDEQVDIWSSDNPGQSPTAWDQMEILNWACLGGIKFDQGPCAYKGNDTVQMDVFAAWENLNKYLMGEGLPAWSGEDPDEAPFIDAELIEFDSELAGNQVSRELGGCNSFTDSTKVQWLPENRP